MKNKLDISNDGSLIPLYCDSCHMDDHEITDCPKLFYSPDRLLIITIHREREKKKEQEFRKNFQRSYRKINSLFKYQTNISGAKRYEKRDGFKQSSFVTALQSEKNDAESESLNFEGL